MSTARSAKRDSATRCRTVEPRLQLPSEEQLGQLDPADRSLLAMFCAEPIEYMAHSVFERVDVETILFGGPAIEVPGSTEFTEPPATAMLVEKVAKESNLTTAQEILLFQRYNYARKRVSDTIVAHADQTMTMDTLCEMLGWVHRVMEARAQLARANLPLVLAMAKRTRLGGLDFNELVSEGNYALLRSIDKFDCSRGFKFSTYACRAILKSFSRVAMRTSRYRGQFPAEFDPTFERSDFVDRKRDFLEGECVDEIRDILTYNRAELNDVEQTVIRERFALDAPTLPAKPKTLEEVGAMIGVTKERVRQIQNKALQKIRVILEESLAA